MTRLNGPNDMTSLVSAAGVIMASSSQASAPGDILGQCPVRDYKNATRTVAPVLPRKLPDHALRIAAARNR